MDGEVVYIFAYRIVTCWTFFVIIALVLALVDA